jgi:translation initiation factor 1
VITGINQNEIDLKKLAKKLKNRFACGGTAKDGAIELQGDHLKYIKAEFVKLGFSPDMVDISKKR